MTANNIPTVLVIFGATGDLMQKKITPALYSLFLKGKLPKLFRVVGVARRPFTREEFQSHVTQILQNDNTFKIQKRLTEEFLNYFYYHQGQFDSSKDYESLAKELGRVDGEWKVCSNKLFYTAVPPQYYEMIFRNIHDAGLTIPCSPEEGWTRVLVEKPFGKDTQTAEKLDLLLASLFKEEQIYRIDHYLAKEMLQNILSFRFSNNLFEESWNNKFIEKIEMRLLEKIGVEKRGLFYDGLGALRDVGQNHLLQMLAFVTMKHPVNFTAEAIRTKRAEILQTLIPLQNTEMKSSTYRAQYTGYEKIEGVDKNSQTETYFKVKGYLDAARWRGVPFTIESGKRMKEQIKDITVTFKHAEPCLCPPGGKHFKDRVIFSLEPDEKIEVHFLSKKPGLEMEVEQKKLEFLYRKLEEKTQYVEEYEKLLLDCVEGNQILFLSTDEVKAMWRYIDPIVAAWNDNEIPLEYYEPDTNVVSKKADEHIQIDALTDALNRQIGVIGLGKMGEGIVQQLLEKKWDVYGWNRTESVTKDLRSQGMKGVSTLLELSQKLSSPRIFWLMLPAGQATDEVLDQLEPLLKKGDIVIDAANAFYKDTIRRSKKYAKNGIEYVDVGFSGGPNGARNGGSLMVGGSRKMFEYLNPLFIDLAIPGGVQFFEGSGAGHFVKMVHNGIEYGMMQAIAEGFDVIKNAPYTFNLKKVAKIYNRGSVVQSRLTEWLENAFRVYGIELKDISGAAGSAGGGAGKPGASANEAELTIATAKELHVSTPVIVDAVNQRKESQKEPNFQGKIINALRNQFGGHNTK